MKHKLVVNVDGVLTNSRTYWLGHGGNTTDVLDPGILKMLEKFCESLGAEVIIASCWSAWYPSPDAWRQLFLEKGADIPVLAVLSRPEGFIDWLTVAKEHVAQPFILFDDDAPESDPDGQVVVVSSTSGLTTVDLQVAAEKLAPGSPVARDLDELNRAMGSNPTIKVSVAGGPLIECPLRDLGKVLAAS